MALKQVSSGRDSSVSAIIGTLLLIAITVILMTTLGIFLFSNAPKGNPVTPRMNIQLTVDKVNYSNEYLMLVQSVTEKIPVSFIKLEFVVSGQNSPIIIPLSDSSTYCSYPIMMHMCYSFNQSGNYAISQFNSSVVIRIYVAPRMNLSYMSVIDMSSDSIIAGSPVTGSTVSASSNQFEPFVSKQMAFQSLTYNQLNATTPAGITYTNESLFFPESSNYDIFEFNSPGFKGCTGFWSHSTPFPYSQLNAKTVKNYGLYATSNIYVSKISNLSFNATLSEPTFVTISQIGNSTNTFIPINKTVFKDFYYNCSNNVSNKVLNVNRTLRMTAGYYKIQIFYLYICDNGIIAFKI